MTGVGIIFATSEGSGVMSGEVALVAAGVTFGLHGMAMAKVIGSLGDAGGIVVSDAGVGHVCRDVGGSGEPSGHRFGGRDVWSRDGQCSPFRFAAGGCCLGSRRVF